MSATRTLPSSGRARPFELPLASGIGSSINELLADVQDALENGEPRGRGEQVDRPLEAAPWREDETGGDHDDALGPRAETDVAAQPERLGLRANVGNEEGAGDRDDREDHRDVVSGAGEDEPDRCEHRALADAVGRRVEEGSERRRLPADSSERAVEDVENRADDEDRCAEPVEEELVPALEWDDDGRRETERDAGRCEHVRSDPRAGEARHRAAGKGAGAGRITVLDPTRAWRRCFVHRVHADRLELEVYRNPAMCRL